MFLAWALAWPGLHLVLNLTCADGTCSPCLIRPGAVLEGGLVASEAGSAAVDVLTVTEPMSCVKLLLLTSNQHTCQVCFKSRNKDGHNCLFTCSVPGQGLRNCGDSANRSASFAGHICGLKRDGWVTHYPPRVKTHLSHAEIAHFKAQGAVSISCMTWWRLEVNRTQRGKQLAVYASVQGGACVLL